MESEIDNEMILRRIMAIEKKIKMMEIALYDMSTDISNIRSSVTRINSKLAVEAREQKRVSEKDLIDALAKKIIEKDLSEKVKKIVGGISGETAKGNNEADYSETDYSETNYIENDYETDYDTNKTNSENTKTNTKTTTETANYKYTYDQS